MGRIIIFTGKGGVGKTSIAAAHALKSAREGKKTLITSADMAHNIGDIFEMPIGNKPVRIQDNLYGLELDPDQLLEDEFPDIARVLVRRIQGDSISGIAQDEHFFLPGLENLFSLLKLSQIYQKGEYERIIVDCAPTGETLSLLKLPELLAWYMEKFFPVGKTMVRLLSPISKLRYHVTLPDRKAMDDIGEIHLKLLSLQELLKDGDISSVRLVCVPEKMVVEETKRSYMYLNLYGYHVDGVFINRVLPDSVDNGFFAGWRDIQREYINELYSVFDGFPLKEIPWYPGEVRGQDAVSRISDEILTDPELFSMRSRQENEVYVPVEGGYQLILRLPGADEASLKVICRDLDLDIELGNQLRRIPLPNVLRGIEPSEIKLENGELRVIFENTNGDKGEAGS